MCGVYDCPLYSTCMIDGSPQVSTKSEERVPAVRSEHQTSPGTRQSHPPKKNRLLWTCGGPSPEERNGNRTEGTKSAVTSRDSKRRALPPTPTMCRPPAHHPSSCRAWQHQSGAAGVRSRSASGHECVLRSEPLKKTNTAFIIHSRCRLLIAHS